jgi:hypothetical protein
MLKKHLKNLLKNIKIIKFKIGILNFKRCKYLENKSNYEYLSTIMNSKKQVYFIIPKNQSIKLSDSYTDEYGKISKKDDLINEYDTIFKLRKKNNYYNH